MNYFLTGTDTDVGKTYVAALWIRALRTAGIDAVGMKPICCGDRDDVDRLVAASGGEVSANEINTVWLRTPAAPYTACMVENRMIDLGQIRHAFAELRGKHRAVLVEGAGGWLVPVRRDYFIADLAAELELPVVVVVRNRLGALNHTLLTVRDIQTRGLACAGLVINNMDAVDVATATNRAILEDLAQVPVLFEVGRDQTEMQIALA